MQQELADRTSGAAPRFPSGIPPAVVEVLIVSVAYICLTFTLMDLLHPSSLIHGAKYSDEIRFVAPMIDGSLAQLLLVCFAMLLFPSVRDAARATLKAGNKRAWAIALMTALIHVTVGLTFFVKEPGRVFELSYLNATFSLVPALDAWSQEVIFRGYVLLRLAKAGAPAWSQIAVSAVLFASIHVGYIGNGFAGAFWPLFGTAMMGGFLAWAVIAGRGALLPVVVAHALIITLLQPWLALS